jgi:hypothetical protein
MEAVKQDIAYGMRVLWRNKGFSIPTRWVRSMDTASRDGSNNEAAATCCSIRFFVLAPLSARLRVHRGAAAIDERDGTPSIPNVLALTLSVATSFGRPSPSRKVMGL